MNKKLILIAMLLIAFNSFGDAIRFDYCKDYRYYKVQKIAISMMYLSLTRITCTSNGVEKNIPLITDPYDTVRVPFPFSKLITSVGTFKRRTWAWPDSISETQHDPRSIRFGIEAVGINNPYFTRQ